jgi:hypothetical protein
MNLAFAAASLFVTLAIAWLVAYALRVNLQAGGQSRLAAAWLNVWTRPRLAKSTLRRRMRRALDRNPVGWLQQHRASARVTKWSWCLAIVIIQVLGLVVVEWNSLPWLHFWLCVFLGVGLAFSASGSFQVERESGAFELLLVTPLREHDIVWGRLRGLWSQFAPGFAVVLGAAIWWSVRGGRFTAMNWTWRQSLPEPFYHLLPWVAAASWLAIPAIGLRASLICRTSVRAWLNTAAWGFLLPGLTFLAMALPSVLRFSPFWPRTQDVLIELLIVVIVAQLLATLGQLMLLERRMARREFHTVPV